MSRPEVPHRDRPAAASYGFEVRVPVEYRYGVRYENGLLDRCGELLRAQFGARRLVVLTDTRVQRLHGARLAKSLAAAGIAADTVAVQDGERSKNLATWKRLVDRFAELRVDRGAVLLNFGGGVTCDLGGFVASAWMRGITYVNFATSLMAQVDAAVGGKVAVNTPSAKNLVGAFHHPELVLGDPELLATLSARDFRSGLAEAIKVGIIGCPELFERLERDREAVRARAPATMVAIAGLAAKVKMDWIGRDPYERDLRRPLNLGHTIGHPIETEFGYRKIRHGEAVAIGIGVATAIALRKGLLAPAAARRIADLLDSYGLLGFSEPIRPDRVIEHVRFVRLIRGNALHFVLPLAVGNVVVTEDVSDADLVLGFEDYEELARERARP
jgi:3-dehydroquinate synthase